MKPELPKILTDYRTIHPEELSLAKITDPDEEHIAMIIQKLNGHANACARMCVFFAVLSLVFNTYTVISKNTNHEAFLALLIFSVGFFFFTGLCLRDRIPKKSVCTHAQYGVVNGKWPAPARNGNTNGRCYFLDVLFPDTRTRFQKVICCYEDYKRAEKGQQVLIVVFEGKCGKNVYGIILVE